MDAQEQHDLQMKYRKPLSKGSRKRVEALLGVTSSGSSVASQRSAQDPIAVAAARFGVTPEELAEFAEDMGF